MYISLLTQFFTNESGQGITEYGAVIGFTAVIMTAAFSLGQGGFSAAIEHCFSVTAKGLTQLATTTS